MEMRVVLKRAAMLFASFALLVALVFGIASVADPLTPNWASRVLAALIRSAIDLNNWIRTPASPPGSPSPGASQAEDPILWVHLIFGIDSLIGLLLLAFLGCVVLAWCWTWIQRGTARRER